MYEQMGNQLWIIIYYEETQQNRISAINKINYKHPVSTNTFTIPPCCTHTHVDETLQVNPHDSTKQILWHMFISMIL